jgi:methanogenic corrinoid protein MtbC1
MVGDFLEAEGWEVLELGASMPAGDLAGLVHDEQPDLVGLSTSTSGRLDAARDAIAQLRALPDAPFIVVGGQVWRGCAAPTDADVCLTGPAELTELLADRFPPLPAE